MNNPMTGIDKILNPKGLRCLFGIHARHPNLRGIKRAGRLEKTLQNLFIQTFEKEVIQTIRINPRPCGHFFAPLVLFEIIENTNQSLRRGLFRSKGLMQFFLLICL
ncbi:MAG: hypothetical protein HC904_17090 [Blastochloris sp.]|nr:hypothetical protein [Blastochloris sp.]